MSNRPLQYQQQQQQQQPQHHHPGYAQSFGPAYSQPAATFTHHVPVANQAALQYNQQLQHGRMQFNASAGAGSNPANVYNPPRPPEVYTLPDNINEALHVQVRQGFQHDNAGRVLFFVGPPLDRTNGRLSQQSAGLGHSIKYLAGHKTWLAEREKKRQKRDSIRKSKSELSLGSNPVSEQLVGAMASQATEAVNQWFQRFNDESSEWKQDAGLQGWGETLGE
jgi:chromatin structure-remodeling complex subunit RSC1/2